MTLGELHLAPTSWSMFSRLAPPGREALLMGLWLLPLFAGSYLAGLIGSHWEDMPHSSFFLLVGSLAATAALGFVALRSEERRGGKECVSTRTSRWQPYHYNNRHRN